MKTLQQALLISLIFSLFFACDKNEIDIIQNQDKGVLLEIGLNSNSYIGENGRYYHSDSFLSKNDTNIYRLSVEAGMKYHIFCVQPSLHYSNIGLILLNSDQDTITYSMNSEGTPSIFFESNVTDELYLLVILTSPYNESLTYNLYFEIPEALPINFLNCEWEFTGNWEQLNTGTLKFIYSDTRMFRWIRLNSQIENYKDISFTMKSVAKTELPSFGFIGNSSTNLLYWGDYQEELPDNGIFLNILDNQNYRVFKLNGTSISYSYGSFNVSSINLMTGIDVNIRYMSDSSYGSYNVYINNVLVKNMTYRMLSEFYLVVEDIGFDDIIFEDFKLE